MGSLRCAAAEVGNQTTKTKDVTSSRPVASTTCAHSGISRGVRQLDDLFPQPFIPIPTETVPKRRPVLCHRLLCRRSCNFGPGRSGFMDMAAFSETNRPRKLTRPGAVFCLTTVLLLTSWPFRVGHIICVQACRGTG